MTLPLMVIQTERHSMLSEEIMYSGVSLPDFHSLPLGRLLTDMENQGKRKINFLITYSPLISPGDRQSDLPLGAQLPQCCYFAKGKRQS